jgi:rod shape-determining protein MreD
MLLDGAIALNGANVLFQMPMAASPYLTLLAIVMPILTGTENQMSQFWLFAVAFLSGLTYDIFYTGYIGIAMIGFPLLLWLAKWIQHYFSHTYTWALSTWFLTLSAYLVFDYLAFGVINVANMNLQQFVLFHMFPSLILNIMFFIVFYYFANWLYQSSRVPDMDSYDVQSRELDGRMPLKRRSVR